MDDSLGLKTRGLIETGVDIAGRRSDSAEMEDNVTGKEDTLVSAKATRTDRTTTTRTALTRSRRDALKPRALTTAAARTSNICESDRNPRVPPATQDTERSCLRKR